VGPDPFHGYAHGGGIAVVSGNPDFRTWHPLAKAGRKPFACVSAPVVPTCIASDDKFLRPLCNHKIGYLFAGGTGRTRFRHHNGSYRGGNSQNTSGLRDQAPTSNRFAVTR
jgi:hypothetical protein